MRFLNKVIFINSATIRYAELMLDGNVHLIGTQGVGKSTLLRAVLFFYNADTLKLGISREKKSFADYYFPYQNSFLIYEVVRETGPFCILAFKSQGKVNFRFLDSGYMREHYVSAEGMAFEKWEDTRRLLDTAGIAYTHKIDSYEEYRKILYGSNMEVGKKEFTKYSLLQSRQYQNIPRTIQNVFLNSKLEAEFIKQTIILSLNEEEITIDLQSYSHHLKDFENQLNDIELYKQPHIQKQADSVVKNHVAIKHLEGEKNKFALQLAWTAAEVNRTIPRLMDKKNTTENEKVAHQLKEENILARFHSKTDKIKGEISVLESDGKKVKERVDYYEKQQIANVVERVGKKSIHEMEQQKLLKEKEVLTRQFSEVTLKYEALFKAIDQSGRAFEQDNKQQQMDFREKAADEKEVLRNWLDKSIVEIRQNHQQSIQQAQLDVEQQQEILNQERVKKAMITHQRFFEGEINNAVTTISQFELAIQQNLLELKQCKSQEETLQKQWELDEATSKLSIGSQQEKLQSVLIEKKQAVEEISEKLQNNEKAFYGWLNNNKPGWESTIGKVATDQLLFNVELSPKLSKDDSTLYGIDIDLTDMPILVKTLEEYKKELNRLTKDIEQQEKKINSLQTQSVQQLEKLKKKYQPQLKETKDNLLERQYKQEQDLLQLQQSRLQLKDWEIKSAEAKQEAIAVVDGAIAAVSEALLVAQQVFQATGDELAKQIKAKERELARKIAIVEQQYAMQLSKLHESLITHQSGVKQQEQELKKRLQEELAGKGADTGRIESIEQNLQTIQAELAFIEDKRDLVAEYKKDKKELIDRADEFKSRKSFLEKQQYLEEEKYRLQREALQHIIKETEEKLLFLQQQLSQAQENAMAFARFQQTEAWMGIQPAYTEEKDMYKNEKSCILLIEEINNCYYKAITRLDNLKESANKFLGSFSSQNIFKFPENLVDKYSYQQFAEDLNEFINNNKIEEFEKRMNERFANVIKLVGKETSDLLSKAGDIQKVIANINRDFESKNFVGAIRKIELRINDSANSVVQLLLRIKTFNDEHSFDIGSLDLFSSVVKDRETKNKTAVDLLKQLSKSIIEYRKDVIALSDSFELQFRVEENENDTGWVEKLSNVGSEGTDVLVKAMINIMLLNVFKEGASKRFKDFRLHCVMDEIGKLHPNNIKGILQFANDRNILLINGSPTETNALNYRHIYKLEKDARHFTKVKRIITNYSQS